jgi:hypothetical protein
MDCVYLPVGNDAKPTPADGIQTAILWDGPTENTAINALQQVEIIMCQAAQIHMHSDAEDNKDD